MFTMPYGYGTAVVTEAELKTKQTFYRLHPEMQRRFLALSKYLFARGVPLGVGTGWRIQPANKPGFAQPGNSWHEGVPVESQQDALAIDTVPASSWAAMEPELARFGLRSFRNVNNEPWHIQPIEIPTSRRYATTLPPLKVWDLPGDPPPQEDDDMTTLPKPKRVYDSRKTGGPFAVGESRQITIGMTTEATVGVTVIGRTDTNGFVSVNDPTGETSIIGWSTVDKTEGPTIAPVLTPNGKIVVTVHNGSADVAVDVWATKP